MKLLRNISFPAVSFGFLFLLAGSAQAVTIDKALTIQVYRLCDNAGSNCASLGPVGDAYYAAEVNKIWAQAGISVSFNFVSNINSTAYSYLDDNVTGDGFVNLAGAYGAPGSYSTSVVDLYLVHTVVGAGGAVYGESWQGYGGIVIAMDDVTGFSTAGRIDTIAHELGHNLGLVPANLGGDSGGHSSNPNYLMAGGGTRNIPGSVADIAPSGLGYDFLPADQIALARTSSLLHNIAATPEPMTTSLVGFGLLGIGLVRRRKLNKR